ncbi:SMP-30/gluconolactonase/LRE family protein, partial [Acinetobacter baumannii]
GPDGLAVDQDNRLVVAHASLDAAFVLNSRGEITHVVKAPVDSTITNVAVRPGTNRLVLTASNSGVVLEAELPAPGARLYSHA